MIIVAWTHTTYWYPSGRNSVKVAQSIHKAPPFVEADDEVLFVAASNHIRSVISEFQHLEKPYKRLMIFSGGNIRASLTHHLEQLYSVKLIERQLKHAQNLSKVL